MDYLHLVAAVNQSACLYSVGLVSKTQSQSTHPDHKRPTRPVLVRPSTPSRYLKRRGLMPSTNAFKIVARLAGNLTSSSSSSTSSYSSGTTSPSCANSKSSSCKTMLPTLPSLTGDNLARLMLQLEDSRNSSARPYHCHSRPAPNPKPIGISYFSSESSACSDFDDFESIAC